MSPRRAISRKHSSQVWILFVDRLPSTLHSPTGCFALILIETAFFKAIQPIDRQDSLNEAQPSHAQTPHSRPPFWPSRVDSESLCRFLAFHLKRRIPYQGLWLTLKRALRAECCRALALLFLVSLPFWFITLGSPHTAFTIQASRVTAFTCQTPNRSPCLCTRGIGHRG